MVLLHNCQFDGPWLVFLYNCQMDEFQVEMNDIFNEIQSTNVGEKYVNVNINTIIMNININLLMFDCFPSMLISVRYGKSNLKIQLQTYYIFGLGL